MKNPLLIIAAIIFGLAVFGNWKHLRQFRPNFAFARAFVSSEPLTLDQKLENLNALHKYQEEQIIYNTQNDLDMLQRDYSFKINCLNAVHNITRQERQARFDEITQQYEQMADSIASKADSELQMLDTQMKKEKERLRSLRY